MRDLPPRQTRIGHSAEQGNPVEIRDTAGMARGAVSVESASFLGNQVIGRKPEKAGGGIGKPEHASQKTYEPR